jgi:glycosyltransferase involved in cell wall biosynthesis
MKKTPITVANRPLKVGVFYSSSAPLGLDSSGGGTYEASLALLMAEIGVDYSIDIVNFVPHSILKSVNCPKELHGNPVLGYKMNLAEKLLVLFPNSGSERMMAAGGFWGVRKCILKNAIDLAYFSSPNGVSLVLNDIPFFSTVWDLGHRDLPGFPEVWSQAEWSLRESLYSKSVPRASFTFVDSTSTGEKLERLYGLQPSRWASIGLLESPRKTKNFLRELPFPYLIYPAMKWPHKNHITLLEAFSRVIKRKPDLKLVFTGSDAGNENYIREVTANLGLDSSIVDLGFVGRERLEGLVFHAEALVMPSLLGPTNLPPLEALHLGTPAIVSSHHDFGRGRTPGLKIAEALNPEAWEVEILAVLDRGKISVRPFPQAVSSKRTIAEALINVSSELNCIAPRSA